MKLTKSEKRLLIALFLILLMAAYYFFVFLKQEKALNDLQGEKAQLTERWEKTSEKLKVGKVDKKHLDKVRQQIEQNAQILCGELSQSEFLMMINAIAKQSAIEIDDIQLSHTAQTIQEYLLESFSQDEAAIVAIGKEIALSEDQMMNEIHHQSAEISCRATYQTLNAFIDGINQSAKKLTIEEMKVNSGEEVLKCRLVVGLSHMPSLDGFIDKNDVANDFAVAAQQKKTSDMFDPYQSYSELIKQAEQARAAIEVNAPADDRDSLPAEEEEGESSEPDEDVSLLFDFRNLNYFFAGNKAEISGAVSLQKNALSDHKITFINYRFHDLNGVNLANVAFPEKAVMCEQLCRKMRLKIYSEKAQRNPIKMEVVDAAANRRIAVFGNVEASDEWQYLYADLATDLHFPIMVKRIYIEGQGVQQDLSGELYFDSLAALNRAAEKAIEEIVE